MVHSVLILSTSCCPTKSTSLSDTTTVKMDKCTMLFILLLVPCSTLSQDYTYIGCFYDNNRREVLPDLIYCDRSKLPYQTCQNLCGPTAQYCQSQQMTVELCRDICVDQNMKYFGLSAGSQCFCGGFFAPYNVLGQPTGQNNTCNSQCTGDSSQKCGADFQARVFQINDPASDCFNPGYVLNGDQSQQGSSLYNAGDVLDFTAVCPPPSIKNGAASITCTASGNWTNPTPTCMVRCATPTAPMYANFIAGQTLNDSYAVDDEVLFYCDNDPMKTNQVLTCSYYGDWEPTVTYCPGYTYLGCFYDSNRRETLPDLIYCDRSKLPYQTCQNVCGPTAQYCQSQQMTVELCRDICADQNMKYFGLQAGSQCLCGGLFAPYNVLGQPTGQDDTCNSQCTGDSSQMCGGDFKASVYLINEPASVSDCFNPGYVLNGDQSQQDSSFYNAGDAIDFTAVCPPPSIKNGAASITCTASGNWTDPTPTCAVRCTTPTEPMHANFIAGQTLNDSYAVDDEVLFNCDNDPTKTNQVLTCGYYGYWEHTVTDCPEPIATVTTTTQPTTTSRPTPTLPTITSRTTSTTRGGDSAISSTQGSTTTLATSTTTRVSETTETPTGATSGAMTPSGVVGRDSNVTSLPGTTGPTSITTSSASSTGLSFVPILNSILASLSVVAIIVVIVCLVCRRKRRLKHGSSQGIAASERAVESPGMRDNPTFESNVHDLRMTDVADCHDRNDPYMALTTPHDGPTFQVYEPLREVNSQRDGYVVPINGANGKTGSEFQERPETDYEITHEYQDIKNSVIGRNNSHNESPVCGLQVQPETDYETAHEYGYPDVVGGNIPQYESHINGLQEMSKSKTDSETPHEYEYMSGL